MAQSLLTPDPALFDGSDEPSSGELPILRSGTRNVLPLPVASVPSIRTVFERFELKYWVTEKLARSVLDYALPYLQRDAHAATRDAQRNTSLYLDSRGFQFCENHTNVAQDRTKLRIRAYGRPCGKLAFFEVKRKVKTITLKERFVLPIDQVASVMNRRPVTAELGEQARRTLDDFTFQMCLHRAEPKLYTSCFREAFESRITGEDVRMTIDRDLVYQEARGFDFAPREHAWVALNEGEDTRTSLGHRRAMLELKFNGSPPRWMVELVRYFNLQREAYSKYTTAALQLRGRR